MDEIRETVKNWFDELEEIVLKIKDDDSYLELFKERVAFFRGYMIGILNSLEERKGVGKCANWKKK